jgi:hypothetical protein
LAVIDSGTFVVNKRNGARRDSDHAVDIYAGHRVPGTRAHAAVREQVLAPAGQV